MTSKEAIHKAIDELPEEKLKLVAEFVRYIQDSQQQKRGDALKALYDLFAPVREEAAHSGMSEDEINQLIDEAIDEVRSERAE